MTSTGSLSCSSLSPFRPPALPGISRNALTPLLFGSDYLVHGNADVWQQERSKRPPTA